MNREELLALIRDAFVPQEQWSDRDSERAQRQLGEAFALLTAGCEYTIGRQENVKGDPRTLWVHIWSRGFDWFEGTGDPDWDAGSQRDRQLNEHTFYVPTRTRLADAAGSDWY